MRTLIVRTLILFIVGLALNDANAQLNRKKIKRNNQRISSYSGKKKVFNSEKKYNYVGFTFNSFNYFGDLSPLPNALSADIGFTKPAIGITFGHRFASRYTLRGEFRYGSLSGNDFESADPNNTNARFRYVRNLQFRNRIKELTITGVFDLYKNLSTYIDRVSLTPYVFVGITVFHHNPQAFVGDDGPSNQGNWVNLKPLGTEGQNLDLPADHPNAGKKAYSNVQVAIPFGVGVRYKLNEMMDLSFELGVRYLFTDYIDDVSGNFVDVTLFNDPLAAYLSDRSREVNDAESGNARNGEVVGAVTGGVLGQNTAFGGYGSSFQENHRGNNNDNDLYFVTTLRLSYILRGSFKKAKFR